MRQEWKHTSRKKPLLVVTGGGTGGHVYPALAVVRVLNAAYSCLWIGSRKGIERSILKDTTIPYLGIAAGKLRRDNKLRFAIDIFKVLWGCIQALYILMHSRPVAVFSKGGYVSVPVVFAAFLLRIPVVSHESDFRFGLATRINSKFSAKVCVSWKNANEASNVSQKFIYTGSPVRQEFFASDNDKFASDDDKKHTSPRRNPIIVFLGGSLGALEINELVMALIDELSFCEAIYHQHGSKWRPSKSAKNYIPLAQYDLSFIPTLRASDLIVSRAGGSVLSELAALGRPAILIPLQSAISRGEQIDNARYMQAAGAAEMLVHPNPAMLHKTIGAILHDSKSYARMQEKMYSCATPDAAYQIAKIIQSVDTVQRPPDAANAEFGREARGNK